MTVGRISATCWAFFVVMSVAFLPLGYAIMQIHAIPGGLRFALAAVVILVLWWGPFVYAMYLSMAVMRNGDRRLLKRGIQGTAVVTSGHRTNTVIQEGEFAWEAPRVYKYGLRVTIPDHATYDTTCRICASGIAEGSTVHVAVSPLNKKRVTIDVGQGGHRGPAGAGATSSRPGSSRSASTFTVGEARRPEHGGPQAEQTRLDALAKLDELHTKGVLSDAEFETEKARILE
jgi:hypothetical protein